MLAVPGALVLFHLVLPFALRGFSSRDPRGHPAAAAVQRWVRAHASGLYEQLTIGIAVATAATVLLVPWYRVLGAAWFSAPSLPGWLAGAAAGIAVPLTAAWLGRHPRSLFTRTITARAHSRLLLCASAEELLWRSAGWAVLRGLGLPGWACGVLTVLGFGLLHVPLYGRRKLPYQVLVGSVLLLLATFWGLVPAILAHALHNEVLATSTPTTAHPSPRTDGPRATLPRSQSWKTD